MESGSAAREGGVEEAERFGGFEVVGATFRGPLVRTGTGQTASAVVLSRERAAAALRDGLARLPHHEHRETLVDVAVGREGPVLVTAPPVVTTLERVLDSGHPLSPGHLVTVLAPIADAIRDAAASGVDLAVDASQVGLTGDGAPVLLLSGGRSAAADESPASALRSLIVRCAEHCADPLVVLGEDVGLEELEAFLYRTAPPLPLGPLLRARPRPVLEPTEAPPRRQASSRLRMPRAAGERGPATRPALPSAPSSEASAPPARHRRGHPLDGWQSRLVSLMKRHRGPLAAAAVILLGSVVASGVSAGPSADGPAPQPTRAGSSGPPSSASEVVERPPPDSSPEAAARGLVESASNCTGGFDACAEALTTADSPLRTGGAERVQELLPAGAAIDAVLADENGASALVRLVSGDTTTAASVLIIRTEAGWFIRDVFADGRD
ncbi:hypothetical protein SAMN06295885_1417 [Rathayibacter oskolensis]|uniref:Uncharacterized protein n=1 Tax=Rathayibacter oskolensis TaxID=1891671 RepID=A0A1X7NJ20_9MICO|nr:hypothetical protein [Rathayibacter oskolensis]SMH37830.1 hypothetical protein SAMN06295885_1417 [Rathayibacter oskolensis]